MTLRDSDGLQFLAQLGRVAAFAGSACWAAVRALPRPGLWMKPFYGVMLGSLPLVMVAGLTIGLVIWLHTRSALQRVGDRSGDLMPPLMAAAVLIELAPLAAGLILASRTAASFAAELASMQVHEQLDAMAILGISPMARLIGPRVCAFTLAAPLLTIAVAALAIGSSFIAESLSHSTTWLRFSTALQTGVTFWEVVFSGAKTLIFGAMVGVIASLSGWMASAGAEGVGRAATRGVVAAVIIVLIVDAGWAVIFQSIFS